MSSMGPYSESTEYGHPGVVRVLNDELQWGRTLRARNTATAAKAATEMTELQWGRTLRARNTPVIFHDADSVILPSMGPCFESTEYEQKAVMYFTGKELQWGRALKARNTLAVVEP